MVGVVGSSPIEPTNETNRYARCVHGGKDERAFSFMHMECVWLRLLFLMVRSASLLRQ